MTETEEEPEESEATKEDSETSEAEESSSVPQEESSAGKEPDEAQAAEGPNNQNEAETLQEAKTQDETAAFSARREYKTVKEGAEQKEKVLTAAA